MAIKAVFLKKRPAAVTTSTTTSSCTTAEEREAGDMCRLLVLPQLHFLSFPLESVPLTRLCRLPVLPVRLQLVQGTSICTLCKQQTGSRSFLSTFKCLHFKVVLLLVCLQNQLIRMIATCLMPVQMALAVCAGVRRPTF